MSTSGHDLLVLRYAKAPADLFTDVEHGASSRPLTITIRLDRHRVHDLAHCFDSHVIETYIALAHRACRRIACSLAYLKNPETLAPVLLVTHFHSLIPEVWLRNSEDSRRADEKCGSY